MKFPDLAQCQEITINDRKVLSFYMGKGIWVQLTPEWHIRSYHMHEPHRYTQYRPATRTEIAQAVAACLVHDIEVELPF
jgi:glycine cleavage system pyridoxal-binding protein P